MRVVLRRSRFSGPARCPSFLPGRYGFRNLTYLKWFCGCAVIAPTKTALSAWRAALAVRRAAFFVGERWRRIPDEPHDLKETNRQLREALQIVTTYWSERESCSGARNRTTIRRSVINSDADAGPTHRFFANEEKGRSRDAAGPPFNANLPRLSDLCQSRLCAPAHGEADAAEAEQHQRPGRGLRNRPRRKRE